MKRQLLKEFKVLLAIVFIISLILPFVYSSDTANSFSGSYQYFLPITITDTSNTTRTNVPALLSINGTTYYAASYINSSGTNTAMTDNSTGADVEYSMGDRTGALIPTLPAGGSVNYRLLLGTSTNQSGFPVITGTGGYITTAHNASLENADNITIAGIFDTSASEVSSNIVSKQGALQWYVDSAGSITANITGEEYRPDRDDTNAGWINTAYAYDDNVTTSANTTLTEGTTGNYTIMSFNDGAYVSQVNVYSSATTGSDQIDVDLQSGANGVIDGQEDLISSILPAYTSVVHVANNIIVAAEIDTTNNTTIMHTYSVNTSGNFTSIDSTAVVTSNGKVPYSAWITKARDDIYTLVYLSATSNPDISMWSCQIDNSGNVGAELGSLTIDTLVGVVSSTDSPLSKVVVNGLSSSMLIVGYNLTSTNLVYLRTVSVDDSGNLSLLNSRNLAATTVTNFSMQVLDNASGIVLVKYSAVDGGFFKYILQTYPINTTTGAIGSVIDTFSYVESSWTTGDIAHVWGDVYVVGRSRYIGTITVSSAGDIGGSYIDTQSITAFSYGQNPHIVHLYGNYYLVSFWDNEVSHDRLAVFTISTSGDIGNAATSTLDLNAGAGGGINDAVYVYQNQYVVAEGNTNLLKSFSVNQGSWGDVYIGAHSGGWTSYTVAPSVVATNIRVRYINAVDGGGTKTYSLNEISVSNSASVQASVSSGVHTLALGISGTTLTFYVDGVSEDTDTCYGIGDTAYDWVWARGINGTSVMPLVDNITMGVGGSEVIKYAPNSMITGDTLVNRDSGGSYAGTIHWGTNSNLSITYGAVTAIPSVRTDGASNVQPTQATLYGTLMSLGGEPSMFVGFEYGQTTSYGSNTTLQGMSAIGYFAPVTISGLLPNTTYHFRALGLYSGGVVYGADMTFTTLSGTGATTDIDIVKAGVFNSYVSTNDTLFVLEMNIAYAPYFPTKDPAKYFQLQLLATDNTTILGASPIVQWGDRPESIYLSSASSSALTYQAPYILRVISIDSSFSTNATYTLTPKDWYGTDPEQIDRWCIFAAYRMGVTDNTSLYLQTLTDRRTIITEYAGGYFTEGIPGIAQVRPDLFSVAERKNRVPTLSSATNYNSGNTTVAGRIGATMANDANTVGAILGLNGQQLLLFMILFTIIGAMLLVTSKTGGWGALGAICLSVPLIGASIYFNIVAIGMFTVFAVVMIILWVRQFWWKTI